MKIKKVKDVVAEHPEFKHLIHAVVRQSSGTNYFESYINSSCGIQGGYPGWSCYSNTITFAERKQNRKQIIELLEMEANDFGEEIVEMVSNFGYFTNNRDRKSTMDKDDRRDLYRYLSETKCKEYIIPNLMAWYAAETVARWFFEDY